MLHRIVLGLLLLATTGASAHEPSRSVLGLTVTKAELSGRLDLSLRDLEEAVAIGAKCMWCQYNVISEEGARIAEAGGLAVVMDRCIKVEHARYVGRMHWLGFNTQRITSVRGGLQ